MNEFIISANDYLSQDIQGFYHTDYYRFQEKDNPDYLNHLKNTYSEKSVQTLQKSMDHVYQVLEEDVLAIKNILGVEKLTLCVIPRAKEEDFYTNNQKLFRGAVNNFAINYQEEGLENGAYYILRHTNTKTTHIKKPVNYDNSGAEPYPGITKDTCTIDAAVQGKDILLIDDIYTKTVNIDEDALQALIEAGAKSVTFYAVAKTYYGR